MTEEVVGLVLGALSMAVGILTARTRALHWLVGCCGAAGLGLAGWYLFERDSASAAVIVPAGYALFFVVGYKGAARPA